MNEFQSYLTRIKNSKQKSHKKLLSPSYEIMSEETYLDEGTKKVLKRNVKKIKNNAEELAMFKSYDFSLENLMDVGADKNLKQMQYTSNNMEKSQYAEDIIKSVGEFLEENNPEQF